MQKLFTILIIVLASFTSAFSQNTDSLKKALSSLKDNARVDCFNALSEVYMGSPNWFSQALSKTQLDTAEIFILKGLEEAKRINYPYGMAKAMSLKAELAFEKYNNYLETEKIAHEAISLYQKTANKKGLNKAYWRLGTALHSQSNFEAAISNYDTAYDLSKKTGDSIYVFYSVITLANVYLESSDYKNAFEKLLDLHQLILKNNDTKWKNWELVLIGNLYYSIEDFKNALKYYQHAFQLIKPNNQELTDLAELFAVNKQFDSAKYYFSLVDTSNQRALRFYLKSIGNYCFLQNSYDKALSNSLRSLYYNRSDNDINQVMQLLVEIAKTYLALDSDSAFIYAHEALAMAQQTGTRQIERNSYEILYSVYDHRQQADSALFYHKKYVAIKDSISSAELIGKLAAYTFEQKIELLNKEKEIQHVQLQKQSLLRNILIVSIIVLLLLAAIIVRNVILKRKNEKLRLEHELDLQHLESKKAKAEFQQQTTELEMQALRAQMNPHFIFNSLNSINRFILQNNRAQASEYLTKFSKLVRLILQNSQASLIPLDSELESLELYLKLEALRFNYHFDYKISVPKDMDISALQVPPLILQPYVENAIWHGLMHKEEKGVLDIEVSEEHDHLYFKITDNGIGREKAGAMASKSATKHKSMGLRITAHRIAMIQNSQTLGSSVTISDLVDADGNATGTEVTINIPVVYD